MPTLEEMKVMARSEKRLRKADALWAEEYGKKLAERVRGGQWEDPNAYNEEQRDIWRGHARFLWGIDE